MVNIDYRTLFQVRLITSHQGLALYAIARGLMPLFGKGVGVGRGCPPSSA
jgi:hypothetical protein